MAIVRLVLDVLKSIRGPSIIDLAEKLAELEGVSTVSVKVNEVDVETLTLTVIVEGNDITFEDVRSVIEDMGGVIHSVDEVIAKS
ncbi:MAG: hypothetical protein DRO39_00475 [Thermoprotei archaeon]|nr:MAG: hypothetical protein DRO39_00475 [Thermoprotei archaeon]